MIELTKINDEKIVLNSAHIECVEEIPESKVIMTTGKYYIVKESAQEIIRKSIEYNAGIRRIARLKTQLENLSK